MKKLNSSRSPVDPTGWFEGNTVTIKGLLVDVGRESYPGRNHV